MMPSDDEDQGDAYLKRVKAEGMAMGHEGGDDDDDDDESGLVFLVLFFCSCILNS